jgi:hypothetical protein
METSAFYPELALLYPDAPWLTFDRALNVAARTLCRIGMVWRADLDPLSWEAGISQYDLAPPYASRVVQILTMGGLEPRTPQQLAALNREWRTQTGRPSYYYPLPEDRIRVYPTPVDDETNAVTPRVVLMPTIELTTLSDDYAWTYERLLVQGAIAHLGGASWSEYERACHEARSHATDGNQVGVARKVRYGGL